MIHYGFFGATASAAITDSASALAYTAGSPPVRQFRLIVSGSVAFHMQRNAAASQSSAYVPADTPVELNLFGGDTLNVIAASGDGTIFITQSE